jgi:phenylalanyl-tRNA synthetase alpha chain
MELKKLKTEAEKAINRAKDLKELDDIFRKYVGRKGKLALVFRSLKDLPKDKRADMGREANELKEFLEEKIRKRKSALAPAGTVTEGEEWIDVTAPGKKPILGHLHPLTLVRRKVEEIFQTMGFSVVEGPEMETEWYNFDALNIPKDHPARDLWDTFYLENGLLLRTHTSPVQIRYMEKNQPPLRIIVPGRVFRHEATDASHEINFYQVEGLMVGREVSVANFKAIIQEFLQRFFEKPIKIRLRPSFFPFTEPSFEVDIASAGSDWLELMGAGMVHPNVLKAAGLNPKMWQGFAFGIGLDRLAMMKYKINDIRLFYSGDLRFLQQF